MLIDMSQYSEGNLGANEAVPRTGAFIITLGCSAPVCHVWVPSITTVAKMWVTSTIRPTSMLSGSV